MSPAKFEELSEQVANLEIKHERELRQVRLTLSDEIRYLRDYVRELKADHEHLRKVYYEHVGLCHRW